MSHRAGCCSNDPIEVPGSNPARTTWLFWLRMFVATPTVWKWLSARQCMHTETKGSWWWERVSKNSSRSLSQSSNPHFTEGPRKTTTKRRYSLLQAEVPSRYILNTSQQHYRWAYMLKGSAKRSQWFRERKNLTADWLTDFQKYSQLYYSLKSYHICLWIQN
jgi:hypothetical protein